MNCLPFWKGVRKLWVSFRAHGRLQQELRRWEPDPHACGPSGLRTLECSHGIQPFGSYVLKSFRICYPLWSTNCSTLSVTTNWLQYVIRCNRLTNSTFGKCMREPLTSKSLVARRWQDVKVWWELIDEPNEKIVFGFSSISDKFPVLKKYKI